MPYLIGLVLSLAVAVFARRVGLDRDRAFYPTVTIVVATYYVLFATIGGSTPVLVAELLGAAAFVLAAVVGFRASPWIVVMALTGHGLFDAVHGHVIDNVGMPAWWPAFCGSYDIGAGAWLAWLLAHDGRRRAAGAARLLRRHRRDVNRLGRAVEHAGHPHPHRGERARLLLVAQVVDVLAVDQHQRVAMFVGAGPYARGIGGAHAHGGMAGESAPLVGDDAGERARFLHGARRRAGEHDGQETHAGEGGGNATATHDVHGGPHCGS